MREPSANSSQLAWAWESLMVILVPLGDKYSAAYNTADPGSRVNAGTAGSDICARFHRHSPHCGT
jgi:hypothetical protein